nr:RNA cytidine acetyltransferase 1-like [Ipomoea batatas]
MNQNSVTGEHTSMVLKPLNSDDVEVNGSNEWGFFGPFYQDFRKRFARLLDKSFPSMEYKLVGPPSKIHNVLARSYDPIHTPLDLMCSAHAELKVSH